MPGLHKRGREFYDEILSKIDSHLMLKINNTFIPIGKIETEYNEKVSAKTEKPKYSPDNEIHFEISLKKIIKSLFQSDYFQTKFNIKNDLMMKISLIAELEAGGIGHAEKERNGIDLRQYELRNDNSTMINLPLIFLDFNNYDIIRFKKRIQIHKEIYLNIVSTEKYGEYC